MKEYKTLKIEEREEGISIITLENRTQNVCGQSIATKEASLAFFDKREPKFDKW